MEKQQWLRAHSRLALQNSKVFRHQALIVFSRIRHLTACEDLGLSDYTTSVLSSQKSGLFWCPGVQSAKMSKFLDPHKNTQENKMTHLLFAEDRTAMAGWWKLVISTILIAVQVFWHHIFYCLNSKESSIMEILSCSIKQVASVSVPGFQNFCNMHIVL